MSKSAQEWAKKESVIITVIVQVKPTPIYHQQVYQELALKKEGE